MKTTVIMIIITLILESALFSQPIYEGTINSKYKIIKFEDNSFKFVVYNKDEQAILIYNIDNTLWKTINLPLPRHHLLDEIKLISQYTFNSNEQIEVIYSCVDYEINSNYQSMEEEYVNSHYSLNLINEKGELLLKIPDSNEMEIFTLNGQKKLIVYKHNGKPFNSKDQTLIYTLQTDK